jgi:NAD(P)-dependent dehydrogenase (short-subunit alcohol dehydrogenase family)
VSNPMDLTARRVLVTGASSGIGRATSILLSQLGAQLILVGRSRDGLHETLRSLEGTGHLAEPFDLCDLEAIQVFVNSVAKSVGPLSGLVHSAGIQVTKPLRFLAIKDQQTMLDVNYLASLGLVKAFRQRSVHTDSASVVLVSSVMALVGQKGQTAYAATKGAMVSAARAMALELAEESIRINCVAPGVVEDTEMTARARTLLTPEQIAIMKSQHPLGTGKAVDVACSIAFLLGDAARWITGTVLTVDGGYSAQ